MNDSTEIKSKSILTNQEKITAFGEGEWVDEPDLVEFTHCGIRCQVMRIFLNDGGNLEYIFGGHLCGYVMIPKDHPLHDKDVEIGSDLFDVHGGITYSEISKDGEKWIGFDCAHFCDVVPSIEKNYLENESIRNVYDAFINFGRESTKYFTTYKNIDYVIGETKSLAEQLKKKSEKK